MRTGLAVAGAVLSSLLVGCGAADPLPVTGSEQAIGAALAGPSTTRSAAAKPEREPRGSEDWRISQQSQHGEVAAYTTRTSGLPGTRVGLKVSTTEGGYEASAFRIGAYEGGTGALVWESGERPGREQEPPRFASYETRTVVAQWTRDLTVDTSTWEPGFYVFRLRTGTGWETQVPYVVTSPSAEGTVALVAPVTTWQAYNQ